MTVGEWMVQRSRSTIPLRHRLGAGAELAGPVSRRCRPVVMKAHLQSERRARHADLGGSRPAPECRSVVTLWRSAAVQGFRRIPDSIAAVGSCQIAMAVFIGRNPSFRRNPRRRGWRRG